MSNEWKGFKKKLKDAVKLKFKEDYSANGGAVNYSKGEVIACNRSIAEKYKRNGAKVEVIKFEADQEIERLEAAGQKQA